MFALFGLVHALTACAGSTVGGSADRRHGDLLETGRSDPLRAAKVEAEATIRHSAGHPRQADVQLALARAYDYHGDTSRAVEQYGLFLSNFPSHREARGALRRAAELARTLLQGEPLRWYLLGSDEPWLTVHGSRPVGRGASGLVVMVDGEENDESLAVLAEQAAVAGMRVVLALPLSRTDTAFDPLDRHHVAQLAYRLRRAAQLPIAGFFIGEGFFVPPRTEHASDRIHWQRAGIQAQAIAAALKRVVDEVSAPGLLWMVAVSPETVLRPADALLTRGQDIAELVRATPTIRWVIPGAREPERPAIRSRLQQWGVDPSRVLWVVSPDENAATGVLIAGGPLP